MCGRYTLQHSVEEVAARFAVEELLFHFPPRYNVAPMQPVAVVTQNAFGDGLRLLEGMRWGLVPFWAKDEQIGNKLIHARSETIAAKPAFKAALRRRRCLIPCDGFYEWVELPGGKRIKQPMHIRFRDGRLFAFAGLWEEWQAPDGSPLRTCAMITSEPNPLLSTLHHRMAVMLRPEEEDVWLDPALSVPDALDLLQIFPDDELEAFPVHRKVGNVVYDDESCIAPLEKETVDEDDQLSLL